MSEGRKFIEVTGRDGTDFLVPVDLIAYVEDDEDHRTIRLDDARKTYILVWEPMDHIGRLLRR